MTYCVVPAELARKLGGGLRRMYADNPSVELIVDRRVGDRRGGADRRSQTLSVMPSALERRRVQNADGRRVAPRRAMVVPAAPLPLPRRAQRHADRLQWVTRLEPSTQHLEDVEAARLICLSQAGDQAALQALYVSSFDHVYTFLHLALGDAEIAEELTNEVFGEVIDDLPEFQIANEPFRVWIARIMLARGEAHQVGQRLLSGPAIEPDPVAPELRHGAESESEGLAPINALTDAELVLLIERLPVTQRQVLMLRYQMGLSIGEIAGVSGMSPDAVRQYHARALEVLDGKMSFLSRPSRSASRNSMTRLRRLGPVLRERKYAMSAW
jgi:RNA polymerase sigma factor (sigma-70 family)